MSDYKNNFYQYYEQIKDRIQKITEALYRVTELFPDEEPLRWMLRKEAVEIFDNLIAISADSLYANVKKVDTASRSIGHIVSVLDLASAGTLISSLNFEVLKREYAALHNFINTSKESLLPQPINFLPSVDQQGQLASPLTADPGASEERQKLLQKNDTTPRNEAEVKIEDKKNAKHVRQEKVVVADTPETDDKMLERHRKILEFIKNNGWVGVGDVSGVFGGNVSEKTVQRDLVFMAESGILRKAGDKRWRRYAVL